MRHRAYKTELKLNNAQKSLCLKHVGAARYVYNWGLAEKKKAYEVQQKTPRYVELSRRLTALKKTELPWLYEVSAYTPQEALQHLDKAFDNFFKKKCKYPKFKSRKGNEGSFKIRQRIRVFSDCVQLTKIGMVRLKERDYLPLGVAKSAVISQKGGRWFISINCETDSPTIPAKDEHDVVGVDLGLKTLATVSDGSAIENPKPLHKNLKRLKRLQKSLSRKKKGSNNRKKAVKRVAKLYARVANIRKDSIHKFTTKLAKTKRVIVIEDLDIQGMLKNRRVSRGVSDASFYEIRRQLTYKSEWYGCKLVVADRFFPSSRTCHVCGRLNEELKLNDRAWTCDCGVKHNRDFNAAKNLELVAASSAETKNACGEIGSGCSVSCSETFSLNQE